MRVHEYAVALKLLRSELQEVTTFTESDTRTAKLVYERSDGQKKRALTKLNIDSQHL